MNKKIIAVIACLAIAAAGIGLYLCLRPDTSSDAEIKNITLTISADDVSETYQIETKAETLGEMLVDEHYVRNEQSANGLYFKTVYGPFEDGRTVDDSKEEWWSLTKDGEMLMTGADQTAIADGEKYEISLRVGYDSF